MTDANTGASVQAFLSDAAKLQQGSSDWLAARVAGSCCRAQLSRAIIERYYYNF